MACDKIENYEKHPAEFQFLRDVPCDWAQSRLLDGKIGEYVVMARQDRHSDDWYVGAITNEDARDIIVPLTFLGDGEWMATIYADATDAISIKGLAAAIVAAEYAGYETDAEKAALDFLATFGDVAA